MQKEFEGVVRVELRSGIGVSLRIGKSSFVNGFQLTAMEEQGVPSCVPFFFYRRKEAYGVVVSMFDFHHSDRGSNPGHGSKIS